jgi:hypothetical protein
VAGVCADGTAAAPACRVRRRVPAFAVLCARLRGVCPIPFALSGALITRHPYSISSRPPPHLQVGEHSAALAHYDRALELAQQDSDREAEGMVLLGKGFALMSIGRAQDAVHALATCQQLSANNPAQERFVADLLSQAQAAAQQQQQLLLPPPPDGAAAPPSAPASKPDARLTEKDDAATGTATPAAPGTPHMPVSTGDHDESAARAAEDQHDAAAREGGGSSAIEHAVRTAFVRSVVLKETVVLVMQGSPSAAETPRQHALVQVCVCLCLCVCVCVCARARARVRVRAC